MLILSPNDWNSISVSLRKMNEITLTRDLNNVHVEVSTTEAPRAWKNIAMLVGVKVTAPQISWHQYFESVESARKKLESWNPT